MRHADKNIQVFMSIKLLQFHIIGRIVDILVGLELFIRNMSIFTILQLYEKRKREKYIYTIYGSKICTCKNTTKIFLSLNINFNCEKVHKKN